jgi:VanZ family protein
LHGRRRHARITQTPAQNDNRPGRNCLLSKASPRFRAYGLRYPIPLRRALPRTGLVATALLIVVLTLSPFEFSFTEDGWNRLLGWNPHPKASDVISNLLLFSPFGFAGFYALGQARRVVTSVTAIVVSGLSLSTVIEMLQAFDKGRDSSIDDVVLNTCGTALGFLIACAACWWSRHAVGSFGRDTRAACLGGASRGEPSTMDSRNLR